MTRAQRRAHAAIWVMLTPALLVALAWLTLRRPAPGVPPPAPAAEPAR